MKFWGLKRENALYPAGDESIAEFEKIPLEKSLQIEVTKPRNPKFHRLFWELCARIGRGIGRDAEWVERAFKVETGHIDVFRYGGTEHLVLRSIAFHKMDDIAFKEFFERCLEIMYRVWQIESASVADLLIPGQNEPQ